MQAQRTTHGERGSVRRHRRGSRGAILVVVLALVVVLLALGAGIMSVATVNGIEAARAVRESQAFWAAEAGLQEAIAWARKPPPVPYDELGLLGTGVITGSVLAGTGVEASYSVDILEDPAWPGGNVVKRYVITSRGLSHAGQAEKVVTISTVLQTFANYMHASNYESTPGGDPIYFAQYDVIDGPIYVNDQLHIWKNPQILQLAVSAADSVDYGGGGADESVFQGGLELGAVPIDFQGLFSTDYVTQIKNKALAGGIALTGSYDLLFKDDGTVEYNVTGQPLPKTSKTLSQTNGAIYVSGSAYVSGVVKGTVTLAAEGHIEVGRNGDNLVYASARSPTPWGAGFNPAAVTDTLGLLARDYVRVMGYDQKNDNKKSTEVTLHASILVTGGTPTAWGFCARWAHDTIGLPALNFFGSVAQYRRGLIGREPTGGGAPPPPKGYSKNFKYDVRLQEQPPLYFPYSNYLFSDWRQGG